MVRQSISKPIGIGGRTADCVGLIKGYGWFEPTTNNIIYATNGMPDIGADDMYNNATEKGTIDTIPEIPGLAVWHEGHIGIYIGNGEVIHAANTNAGVIKTPIGDSGWTHWLKIPYITYAGRNGGINRMRYRGFIITSTPDSGIERYDRQSSQDVLCNGYYCQIYDGDDDQYANQLDDFCIAEGHEIKDCSYGELERGIARYVDDHYDDLVEEQQYYFAKRRRS